MSWIVECKFIFFFAMMISLKIGAEYDFFRKSQIKILCWIAPKTFFGNLTDYASSFGGWGRKIIWLTLSRSEMRCLDLLSILSIFDPYNNFRFFVKFFRYYASYQSIHIFISKKNNNKYQKRKETTWKKYEWEKLGIKYLRQVLVLLDHLCFISVDKYDVRLIGYT